MQVTKGDVLFQIDPRPFKATLDQAIAKKVQDTAQLKNAELDLQRFVAVYKKGFATNQEVDTQQAQVNQLQAEIQGDEAAIENAQTELDYTTITAPIAGRTGFRRIDEGNIVHAADTTGIVTIAQIQPISVVFTLPDDAVQDTIHALDSKKPVLVQAFPRDGGQMLGAGTLTLLNNQIDTATGTVQLKASFINGQHNLWPGQYVNVRLILGTRANALTVPEQAVQRGQGGVYVYVVDDQTKTVQSRPIALTQIQDGIAAIASGVSAGERIVVDGQYKLKPGSKVMEAGRAASGAAAGARK